MRVRISVNMNPRVGVWVLLTIISPFAIAQKRISCPDGIHVEINIRELSIKYDASSFAGTLSSLGALSGRFDFTPKKLQEATATTQQWDEFLKGLAAGYNSCAITREQYAEGLTRLYPRIKADATGLEEIRKSISAGQKANAKQLQGLIDSYYSSLKMFAVISGSEITLQRIEVLSEQVVEGNRHILEAQADISRKLDALKQENKQAPLADPGTVASEVHKALSGRSTDAENAYSSAYKLMEQYRFQEAIPYLQQAINDVPIPQFYYALGRAYLQTTDLKNAEKVFREGLAVPLLDDHHEAQISSELAQTLFEKGELDGALAYSQIALRDVRRIYGAESIEAGNVMDNTGRILREKGQLDEALAASMQALAIYQKKLNSDSPEIAEAANHIGLVLQIKGDLDGALNYTLRALDIDKKVYGPMHPLVALNSMSVAQILLDKGNLQGAMKYATEAIKIDEKAFGPDHPRVAFDFSNIAQIFQAKGYLTEAMDYTKRALAIDEKVYGPNHPAVATRLNNIGEIFLDQGDLDNALINTKRAFDIDKGVYGPNSTNVALIAFNIADILRAKGRFNEALVYANMALSVIQPAYGASDERTKKIVALIARIRSSMQGAALGFPK
jgi:tetratricopeptide (TPR) repeat protein